MNLINFARLKLHNLFLDEAFSEILKGSIWALAMHIMSAGVAMLISVMIARYYGAQAVGVVAVITSYLTLITIFTVLGTDISILRLIPEHIATYSFTSAYRVYRKTEYIVIAVSLLFTCLCFSGAGIVSGSIFSKPHLTPFFYLAAVLVLFRSTMLLNTQVLRGLGLIKTFASIQALPAISNLASLIVLTLVAYDKGNPVYAYFLGLFITAVASCVIAEYSFGQKTKSNDHVGYVSSDQVLRISLPMFMTSVMSFFIAQTGVIILGMFKEEVEVGYYSVAVRLATLTVFVLRAINSMVAPKFSELYHTGRIDELFRIARKSTKLIFLTTAPIFILLIFFGKLILVMLFGKDFVAAYYALVFLVIGQFVNSASGSTGVFLNMTDSQNVLRNIVSVSAIGNIALNLLLIPQFGLNGTALAAMISIAGWNIAALMYVKVKFGRGIGYFPGLL